MSFPYTCQPSRFFPRILPYFTILSRCHPVSIFSCIFNLAIKKILLGGFILFATFTSGKTPIICMAQTSFYE